MTSHHTFQQIYVASSERCNQIKIGKGDTKSRMRDRTMCPDLKLEAAVQDPHAHSREKQLQKYFAAEHNNLEWFNHSERLDKWVALFKSHPHVATTVDEIPNTFATADMYPWYHQAEEVDEVGQGSLLEGLPIERNYQQRAGRSAPQGNGYAQMSSISEDWYTHPLITERVRELYDGIIDLDPMSCLEANRKYVKAELIYTAHQDGLTFEWNGRTLLNPPWGGSSATSTKMRAIKKALYEYAEGRMTECVLVLNSNATTTAWFEPLFAFPMCFPPRRIPHIGPGGIGGAPNSGTVIVYIGKRVERFAEFFSTLGNIVAPVRRAGTAAVAEAENYEDE